MSYRYKVASVFLIGFFIDCINIFMSAVALPSLSAALHISSSSVALGRQCLCSGADTDHSNQHLALRTLWQPGNAHAFDAGLQRIGMDVRGREQLP
ncbi:MAG: hypothetical protein P0Y51_28275 [Candidatus Pseudomonas colombiensis]|nr:MAG: hypothetical protein P0Y51_28275 [Pseudomonas sp.]